MSNARADLPPGQPDQRKGRAPRTNLLLSATIEAGRLKTSVRIRNLSESGALLEGAAFPDIGEKLTLRRLDMEIGAIVVWHEKNRCGVKFDGAATVADWALGTWSAANHGQGQLRVDCIQAAVRAGLPATAPDRMSPAPEAVDGNLDGRIAEELSHLRRLLESMGNELIEEPVIVQRHPKALQGFDLACQTLGHLAAILSAEDPGAAVNAVGMEELRARLLRKAMSRG